MPELIYLANTIINEQSKRFVLCIDIGRQDLGNKLMAFTELLFGNYEHIRIIIAHSSGEGLDEKHGHFFEELEIRSGAPDELKNFDDDEAKVYLEAHGSKVEFFDLKRVTNFNPLLLNTAIKVQVERWKDKYDNICDRAREKGPSGHIKFDHIFQLC